MKEEQELPVKQLIQLSPLTRFSLVCLFYIRDMLLLSSTHWSDLMNQACGFVRDPGNRQQWEFSSSAEN